MRQKMTWMLAGFLAAIGSGLVVVLGMHAMGSLGESDQPVRSFDADEIFLEIVEAKRSLTWSDDDILESSIEVVANMLVKDDDPSKIVLPEGPADEKGYAFYPRVIEAEEIDVEEHFGESNGYGIRVTITARDNIPATKIACLSYVPLKEKICAPLP